MSREKCAIAIRNAVTLIGGATKAGRIMDRGHSVVFDYMHGYRRIPSSQIDALAKATAETVEQSLATLRELERLKAEALEHEAQQRLSARERYYARFGRYPVPARGNKAD